MLKLADFCYRRRRLVLVAWIVALVVVLGGLGSAFPAQHRANYVTPGAESTKAFKLLGQRFGQPGDNIKIVFTTKGSLDDPAFRQVVDSTLAVAKAQPDVVKVISPFDADPVAQQQRSRTQPVAYATVEFDNSFDKLANADANYQKKFLDNIKPGDHGGVDVEVSNFVEGQTQGREVFGLIFAAVILLVAFGSVLAMGLPILTALFGLAVGATVGGVASHVVETPDWAPIVATMIGLGVGIDYSLFIITRYRQSLAKGHNPREATMAAMGTAGRSVLFAGGTVVVSLLGTVTMGLGYMHGVAGSSILAVLAMLAAALTLLPAMLGFVGNNIDRFKLPGTGRAAHQGERAFFYRWSRVVQHRPWLAFLGGALVLLVLTLPLFELRLGFPDDGNNPKDTPSYKAYQALSSGFGPGFNGPLIVVADLTGVADPAGTAAKLETAINAQHDHVAFVVPAQLDQTKDAAQIIVFPNDKPQAQATSDLVHHLRDSVIPQATAGTGAKVFLGGFTPSSIDQSDYISHRLPLFIGAVVVLSFLLLTTVFRSPLVAVKAGIMNLLSIAAAYGVMAYAVKGNWFGNLLHIPETPVPAFVPMIMFAILFGLSMDYEVFLLSRIREEYLSTHDNGLAVADGLALTARVITAAAAIMVFVFGVFIFDPNAFIKQIGLGLTTAVLVDATVVRMVLVPATMELLGDANWWMPSWLNRLLPEVHIEAESTIEAELAGLLAADSTEELKA